MPRQLGDILLEQQVVTRDELDAALAAQTSSDERIGKILVDLGYVSYQDVARALATQMDLSLFGPERINIHDDSWAKLPVDFCLEHALAPVERPDGSLTICMADPLDLAVLEQARQEIGVSAEPAVAAADDIRAALASRMGRQAALDALRRTMPVEGSVEVLQDAVRAADPGETEEELLESVDRTISALLASALHGGADMVLGDPRANGVMFRLRTSNQMRDLLLLPSHVHGPLAGRIADLAGIESPFRTPGSGHFRITHADQVVDVRVSMTPTVRGLRVMLRIVAAEERPPDLHAIGLSAKAQDLIYRALSEQGSAVLVAGILPAGRRQTLQSCLSILPLDSYNVVAIEEGATGRAIAGVAQIDPGADRERYSEAVRTGMLQDPDVLVVSQLRDQASAETTLEAALDGRIVLAAVPAATTRGALEFLLDLGVDERLLAHAATLVLCHHMMREICPNCAEDVALPSITMAELSRALGEPLQASFRRGRGCDHCLYTGYGGMASVYAALRVDSRVRVAITRRLAGEELEAALNAETWASARDTALELVKAGRAPAEDLLLLLQSADA